MARGLVCLTVAVVLALVVVYLSRRLRCQWLRTCTEWIAARRSLEEGGGRPRAPPLATTLALFPLQKWDTMREMLHWKQEMSTLDGLIQTVDAPPPSHPDNADPSRS